MRFSRQISVILFTLFLAKFAADYFLIGKINVIYAFVFVIILFHLTSWELKFYFFALLILFPFTLPQGFPIRIKWWSEAIAIVLFCILFIEILVTKKSLLSYRASIFFIGIGILILWSSLQFIMNPVGGATVGVHSREGIGLRQYSIIVTGICTFFAGFWLVRYKKINFDRFLFIVLILALVIGYLRIMGVSLPFFGDNFIEGREAVEGDPIKQGLAFSENKVYEVTKGVRLTSLVAFSSVLGFYYKKKWGFFPIAAFVSSLMFSILGAGRGLFFGTVFALGLYVSLIKRTLVIPVIVLLVMIGITFNFILPEIDFSKFKYGRVFNIEGGVKKQDKSRYYNFLFMWEIFKKSPIMGKGIGFQPISQSDNFFSKHSEAEKYRNSIEDTIRGGSHGAYLSIASTFGIGGIFYLLVMIFGTMYYSYKTAIRNDINRSDARLALFVLIYASVMSVHMINGGDGIDYRDMWFFPGVIAGMISRYDLGEDTVKYRENKKMNNFLPG